MSEVIGKALAQKPVTTLSSSAPFQAALAQVQKDPVASVYVDMEAIVCLGQAIEIQKAIQKGGVR